VRPTPTGGPRLTDPASLVPTGACDLIPGPALFRLDLRQAIYLSKDAADRWLHDHSASSQPPQLGAHDQVLWTESRPDWARLVISRMPGRQIAAFDFRWGLGSRFRSHVHAYQGNTHLICGIVETFVEEGSEGRDLVQQGDWRATSWAFRLTSGLQRRSMLRRRGEELRDLAESMTSDPVAVSPRPARP
jgi:hypothetical protein